MNRLAVPRLPVPNQDPAEDRLLAMVAALTAELAVVRERLDTVERLAATAGVFDAAAIEGFEPDAAAADARTILRKRIIARVFRPLRDEAERAARLSTADLGVRP